jgi:hypothetical protein
MELDLCELFVLAACGKLPALERTDELSGGEALGGLHNGTERAQSAIKDAPAFVERKNTFVEEGLDKSAGDSAPSEGGSIGG